MNDKTALIVDDSITAQSVLKKMLEKFDYHVETQTSGEEAIEFLQSKTPDVIFLDHMMPGLDGFQTLKHLKIDSRTKSIPVIMYTSQAALKYSSEAKALGAAGVLSKQLSDNELGQMLDRVESSFSAMREQEAEIVIDELEDALSTALTALDKQSETIQAVQLQQFVHQEFALREKEQLNQQRQMMEKIDQRFAMLHAAQQQQRQPGFFKSAAVILLLIVPIMFAQNVYTRYQGQQSQISSLLNTVQEQNMILTETNSRLFEGFRIQNQQSNAELEDMLFLVENLVASIQQSQQSTNAAVAAVAQEQSNAASAKASTAADYVALD